MKLRFRRKLEEPVSLIEMPEINPITDDIRKLIIKKVAEAVDYKMISRQNDKEKRETVYNVINDNQKPLRYGLTRGTKERLAEMIVEALNKKGN